MKHEQESDKKGFTLVEILIYIAILAVVLVIIAGFFWNIALGYIKESSYQEVQHNGRFLLTKITQEIRKAERVITPFQGASLDNLVLEMPDSSQISFYLKQGSLMINTGEEIKLSTEQITFNKLQFTNMSYNNGPEVIRINMQLEYINPSNISAYRANIDLNTTVSLLNE